MNLCYIGLASASFRRTFDTEDDPDIEAEEATNLLDKSSTMSHQQPNLMTFEDFQRLPSDKQSEEIFKLLSMLSPFASEVSSLRSSMESALNRYLFEFSLSDEPNLNTKQSLHSKLLDVKIWELLIIVYIDGATTTNYFILEFYTIKS